MQWLLFLTLLAFTIAFSSASSPDKRQLLTLPEYIPLSSPVRKRTMPLVRIARSSPEEHYSCITRPCKNGATCFEIEKDRGGYFCACSESYRGINCEIEMTSCEEMKCKYFQGCLHSSKFMAVCICNINNGPVRCFHKMKDEKCIGTRR